MNENIKKEALKRLKLLNLHPNVAEEWKKDETVYYSERAKLGGIPMGILYWLNNRDDYTEAVKKAEAKTGMTVYHVIPTLTEFGEILSCLFVSKYKNTWESDRQDLVTTQEDGSKFVMACCIDMADPSYTEFGSIGIKEAGGGLIRTY